LGIGLIAGCIVLIVGELLTVKDEGKVGGTGTVGTIGI
jgi:hypothetical protein